MEKRIAKVQNTFLGFEDHGIFTFTLTLDYGGSGQGVPLFDLRNASAAPLLQAVLSACGVNSWERLPGRTVFALIDDGLVCGLEPLPTEPGKACIFREIIESTHY